VHHVSSIDQQAAGRPVKYPAWEYQRNQRCTSNGRLGALPKKRSQLSFAGL
jgi:hypothetical protein